MSPRLRIIAALEGALRLSDDLVSASNTWMADAPKDELVTKTIIMLGTRAQRTLRAVHHLARESWDDQIAILGRALAELVFDMAYLRTETRRTVGRGDQVGEIVLRAEDKAQLFIDYWIVAHDRLREDRPQKHERWLAEARARRKKLGVINNASWTGVGTTKEKEELERAAEADQTHVIKLYWYWRFLSLFAHASPLPNAYSTIATVPSRLQVATNYEDNTILSVTVMAGLECLRQWSLQLDVDNDEELIRLLKSLPEPTDLAGR